jgi:hypothetical protein
MNPCAAEEFRRSGGPSAVPFRFCCVAVLLRAGDPDAPVICPATLLPEATARPEPAIAGVPE